MSGINGDRQLFVLGGKSRGKRGRGAENKEPFFGAVRLNDEGHPQRVRFDPIDDFKREAGDHGD